MVVKADTSCGWVNAGNLLRSSARDAVTKGVAWLVPDMVSPAAVIETPGASMVRVSALHTQTGPAPTGAALSRQQQEWGTA